MSRGTPSDETVVAGIHIRQARDVSLRAGGDIVAGDKTTIHNYYGPEPQDITKAPYKFLSYYDIGDRDIFFGRDAVIAELAGKIPRHKVLIINGQSGAGKTSLINAGLIPRLADIGYLYVYFRDYTNPLKQLGEYFQDHPDFAITDAKKLSMLQILRAIRSQQESPVVVIFDQFERFFVNVATKSRQEFFQQLRDCLESDLTTDELNLVLSLRDDFFGRLLLEADAIIPTFGTDSHHHNLRALNRKEARQAIIQPLKNIHNIGFDGKFVDEILLPHLMGQATGEAKIEPPHLQIVCNQLYETTHTRYRQQLEDGEPVRIDFKIYHDLGETEGILRDYLDDVICRITNGDPRQIANVRSILKLMIDTVGTRRFESLDELASNLPGVPENEVKLIVKKLHESRVLEAKQPDNETKFSLSHEFMVAKVQSWYDEREIEQRRAEETLERGLAAWKSTGSVLDQQQLQLIDHWIPTNLLPDQTAELFAASKNRLSRQWWLKRTVLMAMISTTVLMPIAVIFWRISVNETQKAEHSEQNLTRQLVTSKLELGDAARQRSDLSSLAFWYWYALDVAESSDPRIPGMRGLLTSWLQRSGRRVPFGIQVSCNAFSPDSRLVVTCSDDRNLHFWDCHHGEPIGEFVKIKSPVQTIVFSHDGKFLGMKCYDNQIRLWHTVTRKQTGNTLEHDDGAISDVACSIDGRTVVLASITGYARLWDVETGKAVGNKMEHLNSVNSVDFSPDGRRVISGSFGEIKCWDVDGPKLLWEARAPGNVVKFSPDGKVVLSCGGSPPNQSIRQWDSSTGNEFHLREIRLDPEVTNGNYASLVMSRDGSRLAAGGANGRQGGGYAMIWNALTSEPIGSPLQHNSIVVNAAFSSDGSSLITGTMSGEVQLWDATVGEPYQETLRQEHSISSSSFSRNGKSVLIRQGDVVKLFDVSSGKPIGKPIEQPGFSQPLASSPNNEMFLIGNWKGTVKLWNAINGSMVGNQIPHDDSVVAAAFSQDGALFVTATRHGLVQAWDSATCQRKGNSMHVTSQIQTIDLSSDGHTALIGCVNGECSSWETRSGKKLTGVRLHTGKVRAVALSPDGQIALSGSDDKTVRLWYTSSGLPLGEPLLHESVILSAVFSPDGRTVLTGTRDGKGRLWDVGTGKLRGEWIRHFGPGVERAEINAVVFSEDARLAMTAGNDGVVRLWRTAPITGIPDWEADGLQTFVEWQTGYAKDENGSRRRLSREEWLKQSRKMKIEGHNGVDWHE